MIPYKYYDKCLKGCNSFTLCKIIRKLEQNQNFVWIFRNENVLHETYCMCVCVGGAGGGVCVMHLKIINTASKKKKRKKEMSIRKQMVWEKNPKMTYYNIGVG